MNSGRQSLRCKWRRWRHEHKRDLDFYLICLAVTLLMLLVLPFIFGATGGVPGSPGIIDSLRYVPDDRAE